MSPTSFTAILMALTLALPAAAEARGPDDRPPPVGLPGPLVGAIELSNERDRPVAIYLDGRFAIEVGARSTTVLEDVPNGTRLVSYPVSHRGPEPRWQTDRVEVREGRRTALRIARLRDATLVVTNPFARKVGVWIDGHRATRLGRHESERIGGLEPGRVRVELRDDGRVLASDVVELYPGRESYFAPPLVRYGAVELVNPTRRAVRITLEERPGGARLPGGLDAAGFRLAPGQRRVIGEIGAGALTIQVTTEDGRLIRHEATIVAGETTRFEVPYAWIDPRTR